MDEYLRFSVALAQARLLELQREIMIDTLVKIPQPQPPMPKDELRELLADEVWYARMYE